MKKKLLAWVLMVLLLLSTCPFAVSASETARVTVQDGTATQGGTVSVYLRADDFVDVSVLDVEVYYDTAAMSVDYVSNSSFLSGASVSTNTAVAGVIKISAMSVNGFSGSGQMMMIRFRVNANCPVGTYPVAVAVGDAYDSNLNPATVRGVSGTVTVKAAATQSFSLSSSRSTSAAQQGDTFTVRVYNSASRAFASADFGIEYDREQLRLTALELDTNLKVEGAVYSINQNNPGYAVISYASTNAVSSYNLFVATFEVIADVAARADIKIIADDVYDNDLVAYAPYTLTTSIQITEKEILPDYADLKVVSDNFVVGQTGAASVILQGGAAVAAADFTLYYDTSVFSVASVTANSEAVTAGAWIVINQNFSNGQIKFSYVNEKGSFSEDMPLVSITLTAIQSPAQHTTLSAAGMGVYSIDYQVTTLDYPSASPCVFAPITTDVSCTEDGYTTYQCACGDRYVVDIIPALGHDEVIHAAQAVTCTTIGWDDYVTCTRCDYTTYVEIPALGHDEVFCEAKAPTCTENGNIEHWCCVDCGAVWLDEDCTISTNQAAVILSALGHTYDDANDTSCNACGAIRQIAKKLLAYVGSSISEDVDGLAFLFNANVSGAQIQNSYEYVTNSAVVTPFVDGATYKLVRMGAVVSNGVSSVDIEAKHLWDVSEDQCSFAVRIINIPDTQLDCVITARPYYVYEVDGEEIVVYGDAVSKTYNEAAPKE